MAGLTFNETVWKEITTCRRNDKTKCKVMSCRSLKIIGFASIAPWVWLVASFLDGDYFACAQTDLPYKMKENQIYKVKVI